LIHRNKGVIQLVAVQAQCHTSHAFLTDWDYAHIALHYKYFLLQEEHMFYTLGRNYRHRLLYKYKHRYKHMKFALHFSGQLSGIMASQPSTREYYSGHVCSSRNENYTSCVPHEKQRVILIHFIILSLTEALIIIHM